MKYLKIFLLLVVMVMALATTLMAASTEEEAYSDDDHDEARASRFLAQRPAAVMTCDKYPRMCRAKGSPGPDCCNKRCVNVFTDRQNCGKCGKKCKYYEMCCKGKCVNPLSDKKNCGGCNNKCKKGNACLYGMCNYA